MREPPITAPEEDILREIVIGEKRVGVYDLMTLRRLASLLAKIDQLRADNSMLRGQIEICVSDMTAVIQELPAKKKSVWAEIVSKRNRERLPNSEPEKAHVPDH